MWRRRRALMGLDEDIRDHIARETEENVARGMSHEEARRQAMVKFGNVSLAQEDTRAVWASRVLDSVRADLRYSVRSLLKHPGYTATAVVTLATAIGLATSVFTVFNGVFVRPWPVPDAGRVFVATLVAPPGVSDDGMPGANLSFAEFEALSASVARSDLVASHDLGLQVRTVAGALPLDRVPGLAVTARFFDVLRVSLQRGAGFSPATADRATATAVISDGFWHRVLGGDPDVLGRVIFVNDDATTIIGVTARSFRGIGAEATDVYLPFPAPADWERTWRGWWGSGAATAPDALTVGVAGRIRDRWSRAAAQTELETLHRQVSGSPLLNRAPTWVRRTAQREVVLAGTALGQRPGELPRTVRTTFAFLFGACGLVLLLACANVGNLQLARNLTRTREIATRLALGAGRVRVVRQLLTEGVLLACLAGVSGVGLACLLPRAIFSFLGTGTPGFDYAPNAVVLTFALLLCICTTIAFGLAPALQTTRRDGHSTAYLKGRATTYTTRRLRGTVLAIQVAISTVLLVAAMLLTRGVLAVPHGLGFAVTDVTAGRLSLDAGTADAAGTRAALQSVRAALDGAGLSQVAYSVILPLEGPGRLISITVPGAAQAPAPSVVLLPVSSNLFKVLDMPLVSGRTFSDSMGTGEIVVSESALRMLPPGAGLGTAVVINANVCRIVGIVRDASFVNVSRMYPMVFRSAEGAPFLGVIVRDGRDDVSARVESIVRAADSRASVTMVPIGRTVAQRTSGARFAASMASGIAGLALALATVGILGVFGYLVEERRREIGIRLALGARRSQVVRGALRASSVATLGGLAAGLVLAVVVGGLLRGYLYGLSPLDPLSYIGVLALLTTAAILATILPARRAARVDPATTLRSE